MTNYRRNLIISLIFLFFLAIVLVYAYGLGDGIVMTYIIITFLISSWSMVFILSNLFKIPTKLKPANMFPRVIIYFFCWILGLLVMYIKYSFVKMIVLGVLLPTIFSIVLVISIKYGKKI